MDRQCVECSGPYVEQFYEEIVPCKHCGEETTVEYYVCSECGIMWKEVDGEIIDTSKDAMANIDEFLDEAGNTDDVPGLFAKEITSAEAPKSMQDMVHKCLKCKATAYEVGPAKFKCPDCGFEWEIL